MVPALPPGTPRRLVFAGEAIIDVVMRVPALPDRGGDMLASSSRVTVGGGFNVMSAAARQGMPVVYAGGHGTGPWGDMVRVALAAEGIRLLRPPDSRRDTGFDVALVDAGAERTFVTSLGAESAHEPGSWDAITAGPDDAVYVSGYGLVSPAAGPDAAAGPAPDGMAGSAVGAWAAALPRGPVLFVDPGPLVAQIPAGVLDPVLARCDWWSCNEREAGLLTGVTGDPPAAVRALAPRTAGHVIVRAGAAGCFLAVSGTVVHVPAPAVEPVDTTGAGDAHAGAFLAALAAGLGPVAAARRANAAAAFAVTRPGPATAPAAAELTAWLATIG